MKILKRLHERVRYAQSELWKRTEPCIMTKCVFACLLCVIFSPKWHDYLDQNPKWISQSMYAYIVLKRVRLEKLLVELSWLFIWFSLGEILRKRYIQHNFARCYNFSSKFVIFRLFTIFVFFFQKHSILGAIINTKNKFNWIIYLNIINIINKSKKRTVLYKFFRN